MKFSSLSCKILHFPKTTQMFVFNLLISFWIYCGEVGKYHFPSCIVYKKDATWFHERLLNLFCFGEYQNVYFKNIYRRKKRCFQCDLENNPKQTRALIGLKPCFYNSIETQN